MSYPKLLTVYFACFLGAVALTGCGGGNKTGTSSPVKAKGGVITASASDKYGWQQVSGTKYCANSATSYIELKGVLPIDPFDPVDAIPKDVIIGKLDNSVWQITMYGSDDTGQHKSAEGITLLARPVPCTMPVGDSSVLLGVIHEGTSRLLDGNVQDERAAPGSAKKQYQDQTCAAPSHSKREEITCEQASEIEVTLDPDVASPIIQRYRCPNGKCEIDIGTSE